MSNVVKWQYIYALLFLLYNTLKNSSNKRLGKILCTILFNKRSILNLMEDYILFKQRKT